MKTREQIISYSPEHSVSHLIDKFAIQRLERIIYFESNCTPKNEKLINASAVLIQHFKDVWGIK